MKKLLIVVLALSILLPISGCGQETADTTAEPTERTTETKKITTPQPIEVKDFGWSLSDNGYLHYGIILYNPNEKTAYDYPAFRITAKDANGFLLGTEEQTLSIIYPEETMNFGAMAFECGEMPADVQVEVIDSEEYNIRDVSTLKRSKHQPFEIVNATMRENKIVGEVINHDTYDYTTIAVSVIFRDNTEKIIGGATTYVDNLKANSNVPFELSDMWYSDFKSNNYEISANIWG